MLSRVSPTDIYTGARNHNLQFAKESGVPLKIGTHQNLYCIDQKGWSFFLLLLFIEGKERNTAEDKLLHLLAQLVAPAVLEFCYKHLLPGSGVVVGHVCGESMAETSLQSATANPVLADWPGCCGWLAAAGAELGCHSQALAILAKAFCSVVCAKHK